MGALLVGTCIKIYFVEITEDRNAFGSEQGTFFISVLEVTEISSKKY